MTKICVICFVAFSLVAGTAYADRIDSNSDNLVGVDFGSLFESGSAKLQDVESVFAGSSFTEAVAVSNASLDVRETEISIATSSLASNAVALQLIEDTGPRSPQLKLFGQDATATVTTSVPEPASLTLFGMGLIGAAQLYRRTRRPHRS